MPPLPSYAFLGVGALVTIVSMILPNVRAFVAVGVIFLIIGAFKLVKEQKQSPKKTHMLQTYSTKTGHRAHHDPNVKYCHVCGMKNHKQANFCTGCGHRIR